MLLLEPIGIVNSPVTDTHAMPTQGVPATVDVYQKFADGLLEIESNSHVVVVSWMHMADRGRLQVHGVGPDNVPLRKGVFAVRSPARPNPLAISTAKLLSVEGRRLHLERLDMVDGTPVVDLKGYTRGGECVFSARTFWDYILPSQLKPGRNPELILAQAEAFHGHLCAGVIAGAKLVEHASSRWDVPTRDEGLSFVVERVEGEGDECGSGCVIDAIMASTGATLGNGRLALQGEGQASGPGPRVLARSDGRSLTYRPRFRWKRPAAGDLIDREAEDFFEIQEDGLERAE